MVFFEDFTVLIDIYLFLEEGTNEQDPVKCFGVGCENPLHRWYVSIFSSYINYHLHCVNLFFVWDGVAVFWLSLKKICMALADVMAYVQKKKKTISGQCPVTTSVKTHVSLQLQYLFISIFGVNILLFWDYYLKHDLFIIITLWVFILILLFFTGQNWASSKAKLSEMQR